MLYIVSTPIGNLKDITLRALDVLKQVDLIAAEDTRHTKILTKHYRITTPLTSYFEHNKIKKAEQIIQRLKEGRDVALVTDAGTPGVSDPGYYLINLAKKEDMAITVCPGPTACIAGLTLSGLPSDSFIFGGFLPVKTVARKKKLEKFRDEERTVLFYESPYRVVKALEDIRDVLENPWVVCAREITKKFEEVREGRANELIEHFSVHKPKGEFVIILSRKG